MRILAGDCRSVLPTLPANSVHCVVTSPPYWGLRDYGVAGQIGLEPTFTEFIGKMVEVFREVRRVLRPDGTLWLNLGDSYAGGGHGGGGNFEVERNWRSGSGRADGIVDERGQRNRDGLGRVSGLKPKDLCGIPWRVAFALQEDGWWLRQDIVWSKPNPMPESVTDRCTKAHEYLFLLTKSARYFYDAEAIKEQRSCDHDAVSYRGGCYVNGEINNREMGSRKQSGEKTVSIDAGRNRRSVWTIATSPCSEAHFATFPPALVEPCIKAGTSEKGCCGKCGAPWRRQVKKSGGTTGKSWHNHSADDTKGMSAVKFGLQDAWVVKDNPYVVDTLGWSPTCTCQAPVIPCTVLDPFGGAGTTGLVADRLQRNAILIELNPTYAEMARQRIMNDAPLFVEAAE